ncbi:MAG: RNA-binding protein [Candidatus Omnitrophica bacterium]|nr:RNA-binding protein [Candidatus Omnitrophota bacterium]MDD5430070.1 RNA-binding protein [Candidatus Omnitrophota bacterium]
MSEEKKIYVGNLEYSTTEDDIRSHLEGKGIQAKDIKVIKDKYTGRSKGFGFVEVDSDDDLNKGIEALEGQELKGRTLKANKARPPREREDRRPRF